MTYGTKQSIEGANYVPAQVLESNFIIKFAFAHLYQRRASALIFNFRFEYLSNAWRIHKFRDACDKMLNANEMANVAFRHHH